MQVPVSCEGEMAPDPVDGDAQQLCVELLKLGQQFLVQGQLVGADGASVLGIEARITGRPRSSASERV